MVGAYPRNGSFDQKRPGEVDHATAVANIANVPLPEMDPVHGRSGAAAASCGGQWRVMIFRTASLRLAHA